MPDLLATESTRPHPWHVGRWLIVLGCIGIAAARLIHLDSDPPLWMPDAALMDEALWADGARGKALFDDWFADDTGNAWLAAPVYNLLMWGSYSTFDVSLWATRLVPACCSLVLVLLVGRFASRRLGARTGLAVALALGLCPFLWAHSRFGFLEVPQAMCIAASFALLFERSPSGLSRSWLAGLMMAAAVGIKPNSALFGVVPVAAAWLTRWWLGAPNGRHVRDGVAVIVGGCVGLACLAALVWIPNWPELLETWEHESGLGTGSLGEHMLRLGFAGSRERPLGQHALWGPLRSAPLLTTATWLYLLHTIVRLGSTGTPLRQRLSGWEWPVLTWMIATFAVAELSYASPARRAIHMVAPMAMLSGVWWGGRLAPIRGTPLCPAPSGPVVRAALWATLSLPVCALIKPFIANGIRDHVQLWFGDEASPTSVAGAAGLVFLAGWFAAMIALSAFPWRPHSVVTLFLRHLGPPLLVVLAVVEVWIVGKQLVDPRYTILEAQRAVQEQIDEGETVFGHSAALLVQGKKIRAIRWVRDVDAHHAGPRPNPDAYARLQPRYIITYTSAQKRQAAEPAYDVILSNQDPARGALFEPVLSVHYCIEAHGYPRWNLQLWRRRD